MSKHDFEVCPNCGNTNKDDEHCGGPWHQEDDDAGPVVEVHSDNPPFKRTVARV